MPRHVHVLKKLSLMIKYLFINTQLHTELYKQHAKRIHFLRYKNPTILCQVINFVFNFLS